jgi:hypothetical protein
MAAIRPTEKPRKLSMSPVQTDSYQHIKVQRSRVMSPGPYYALGTIGTVPRAYDIFRAYEGMEEETITIKKLKIQKCTNNSFCFKN